MQKFKHIHYLLGILIFSGLLSSAHSDEAPAKFSEVMIDMSGVTLQQLAGLGLAVDHNEYIPGDESLTIPVSEYELQVLRDEKINHKVLIDDYSRYIEMRNIKEAKEYEANPELLERGPAPPQYFKHGSMGGYLIFSEVIKEIDEMRTRYPKLVSKKWEIGKSGEGRSIWAFRVSNNPDVDQPNKTKIVYNTLTHAREPMAMMSMMWFIWHILEVYETDPKIKKIIDSLEIYYIPVVNPDGFEHNRTTNPNGGGMWRKNRRRNSDGSVGVDNNRNYSTSWGNNSGSSGVGSAGNYRGTAPFSEPENKHIRAFYNEKKFKIASTFHCFANKLLHPYGLGQRPANFDVYTALSKEMTRVNRWQYGTLPIIGYSAAGVEIDWAHDMGVLAVNPEMGTSSDGGFWPSRSRINSLAETGGLDMNIQMACFAIQGGCTITGISDPKYKITTKFNGDINKSNGQMRFVYNLTDNTNDWFLTVSDLSGKQYKKSRLTASEGSVSLAHDEVPGSLFIVQVKSCNASGCNKVYSRKLIKNTY